MPIKRQHMWDAAVDEIVNWVTDSSDELAAQLMESGHAPGAARISEEKKLAYYRRKMFNDDGVTPNEKGREQVLSRVGVGGYAAIMKAFKDNSATPDIRDMYTMDDGTVTTAAEQG